MARQVIVLSLVLFAVVGYVSAAEKAAAAPTGPPDASLEGLVGAGGGAPVSEDTIGTTADSAAGPGAHSGSGNDNDVAVAAPLGSNATYASYPPTGSPKSGASALLHVSGAVAAGVAAAVGSFFFF